MFISAWQESTEVDGISMGSSLGPVLANVFMTELEIAYDTLVRKLVTKPETICS